MDIVCQRCATVNDYYTVQAGPHLSAYCNNCDRYIKHLPKDKPVIIHFGKYKGRELSGLVNEEDIRYLKWLSGPTTEIKSTLKEAIVKHLASLV